MVNKKKVIGLAILLAVLWFIPTPDGLTNNAWHMFAIFVTIIIGIIIEAMPIGAMGLLGIGLVAVTGVTTDGGSLKANVANAMGSLSNPFIWLIVLATIMSRAIIKTGLGERIAYYMLSFFGKTTLGTGYALSFSELILAPFTPSNTARGGGIIHPIMQSISNSMDSKPNDESRNRAGRFLAMVNYNTNPITSAMFITATAPNPIIVDAVSTVSNGTIQLDWTTWALAMLVPGIIAILVNPLIINFFYPPTVKRMDNVKEFAKKKLAEKGAMHLQEKIVLGVFAFLLIFWANIPKHLFGFGLDTTTTILVGVLMLILTKVLSWDEVLAEKNAWSTLIWFASLVMMAGYLNKLGFISWFSEVIQGWIKVAGMSETTAIVFLVLVYLYAHYFFASTTAHITAMFATFYGVGLALGADPMIFALILASSSSIMMHLTHYATGTSPIIFSSGYITLKEWWKIGFILSVSSLLIFSTIGVAWWKMIF